MSGYELVDRYGGFPSVGDRIVFASDARAWGAAYRAFGAEALVTLDVCITDDAVNENRPDDPTSIEDCAVWIVAGWLDASGDVDRTDRVRTAEVLGDPKRSSIPTAEDRAAAEDEFDRELTDEEWDQLNDAVLRIARETAALEVRS